MEEESDFEEKEPSKTRSKRRRLSQAETKKIKGPLSAFLLYYQNHLKDLMQ